MNEKQKQSLVKYCEKLKENANYAIMFIDGYYTLVDTENNAFDVIGWIEFEKEMN